MWRESGKQQADLARPGGQVSHPCPMAVPGMCAGDLEIEIPRGECSARRASSGSPTGVCGVESETTAIPNVGHQAHGLVHSTDESADVV